MQLADGTRIPTSGIQDADVQMVHVAKPVMEQMFSDSVVYDPNNGGEGSVGYGLLVHLNFNSAPDLFTVEDTSGMLQLFCTSPFEFLDVDGG